MNGNCLPSFPRVMFDIFVVYTLRFKESVVYYAGWRAESLLFEDKYTNKDLGQLFDCGKTAVSNIVLTYLHVLHELWFKDIMIMMPSRKQNQNQSAIVLSDLRMVVDCKNVEIVTQASMDLQKQTYLSYKDMHKVLTDVAFNAKITCSNRFLTRQLVGSFRYVD